MLSRGGTIQHGDMFHLKKRLFSGTLFIRFVFLSKLFFIKSKVHFVESVWAELVPGWLASTTMEDVEQVCTPCACIELVV